MVGDGYFEDTRAYYEEEARRGLRRPQYGRNVELRAEAVALFSARGARRVLDVGAGPGLDAAAFSDAELAYIGVDMAVGNGHVARNRGTTVVPASITALPFASATFDCAWSMSTFMHLDVAAMHDAVRELGRVVHRRGVCFVSMWGGDEDEVEHGNIEGQTRHYFLRSTDENRAVFADTFHVESCRTWPDDHGIGWQQQVFVLTPR